MKDNLNEGEKPDYTLNSGRVEKIPMVATVKNEGEKELLEWVKASVPDNFPEKLIDQVFRVAKTKEILSHTVYIYQDFSFIRRSGEIGKAAYKLEEIEWLRPLPKSKPIDSEEIERMAEEKYNKEVFRSGDGFRIEGYIAGATDMADLIQSRTQSNLQSKGSSKEQLYFNTLTEGQRIKYFKDVEELKKGAS